MRTILLVEDDDALRDILAETLEEEGYKVVQAWNGKEAYGIATAIVPDLVISDIGITYLSGVQLLAVLNNSLKTRNIPVIAITGTERLLPLEESGFREIIYKPFDMQELIDAVGAALPDNPNT